MNFAHFGSILVTAVLLFSPVAGLFSQVPANNQGPAASLPDRFQWQTEGALIHALPAGGLEWHAIKDPSIVQYDGKWHLFCTVRGKTRSHAVVYLNFEDWNKASEAQPRLITCHGGYFCAPQVFYFAPQQTWYMICQASSEDWAPQYQAAFSTTKDISDPDSWSPLQPLGALPADGKAGLDFWIICDENRAHLFFTTLDGRMWREETTLASFPHGWSKPKLAIQADIFEAAHIYRLQEQNQFLALIEAQGGHGWRYYKAFVTDTLDSDGAWTPLAAEKAHAFACMLNVRQKGERWTDVVSHGELLRSGFDQSLEVRPDNLVFLIQGVLDQQRAGKGYGDIPWKLGILRSTHQKEIQLAECVLLHQRENGGWPKNYDRDAIPTAEERASLAADSKLQDTTFDNGATHKDMRILAETYQQTSDPRYREAFLRGLRFTLAAQYENGGWPQFYPNPSGYHAHITFNDNAMIGVMRILREIAEGKEPFGFVEPSLRDRCGAAVKKGIDCILKCQIEVNGKKTAWCAQHDSKTLLPAAARSYELASISGSESVGIVEFLMQTENPDENIIDAVESAVAWFREAQLTGIEEVRKEDPSAPRGWDKVVVQNPDAPPIWARFYEIGTNQPIFCSRDGIPRRHLSEISYERRTGYSWLGQYAARLLERDYPAWKQNMTNARKAGKNYE